MHWPNCSPWRHMGYDSSVPHQLTQWCRHNVVDNEQLSDYAVRRQPIRQTARYYGLYHC